MKLVAKITEQEEIKQHLQGLSETRKNVRLYTKEGAYLQKGFLSIEPNGSAMLSFTPLPETLISSAILQCQYTFKRKPCVFQTRRFEHDNKCLSLEIPYIIHQFERRSAFRIQPPKAAPVFLRLPLPNKMMIRLPVFDISCGGVSILIPHKHVDFNIGDKFDSVIEIPQLDKIDASVVVRGIFSFLGVSRIGFSFHVMTPNEEKKVLSYTMSSQKERIHEGRKNDELIASKVCVVETNAESSFAFLSPCYNFSIVSHLDALRQLKQHPPEAIILNMNYSGAKLILKSLSRDPRLKNLPLILLGQKNSRPTVRTGVMVFIDLPYKPKYLISKLNELIEKVRLAKEVKNSFWQHCLGSGKTVAIVDPSKRLNKILFKQLEWLEFNLSWIRDEKGVIDQLGKSHPDVIVLDDSTGTVDVTTICRLIRLNRALKNVPKVHMLPTKEMPQSTFFENMGVYYLDRSCGPKQLACSIFKALGFDL